MSNFPFTVFYYFYSILFILIWWALILLKGFCVILCITPKLQEYLQRERIVVCIISPQSDLLNYYSCICTHLSVNYSCFYAFMHELSRIKAWEVTRIHHSFNSINKLYFLEYDSCTWILSLVSFFRSYNYFIYSNVGLKIL